MPLKQKYRVVGYLVKCVDDDTGIKDVLSNRKMHMFYSTFEEAVEAAQLQALEIDAAPKRCYDSNSKNWCDTHGEVTLFEIHTYGYTTITAHALYVHD